MSTQTNNTLIKYSGVEICQKEQVVLKDVALEIAAGEFYYLIGSVGSGKSSLINQILYKLNKSSLLILDKTVENPSLSSSYSIYKICFSIIKLSS